MLSVLNGQSSVIAEAIDDGLPVIASPTELRRKVESGGEVSAVSVTSPQGPTPVSKNTLPAPAMIACVNVMREPAATGMFPKSKTVFDMPVPIVRVTAATPREVPLNVDSRAVSVIVRSPAAIAECASVTVPSVLPG